MNTPPPAFARMSLIVAPPGPMRGPTSSGGTCISFSSGTSTDCPGAPGGRGGAPSGRGPDNGQPLLDRASRIIFSVFSTSPTIVTVPSRSCGRWSILTSAPLRCRISRMVSPPLPISARICTPSIRSTLKFSGAMPGGGFGPSWETRSCNQSGTSLGNLGGPSSSHFVLRLLLSSSAVDVDDGVAGGLPPGGMGVEHCGHTSLDR